MNKSAIPWCDFTWNPIVGCENGCSYCYARRIATTRLAHLCPKCATFEPHLHEERLRQPYSVRKPALIFADSMADRWSPGVAFTWRFRVYAAMFVAPWHRFVVLTKRPDLIIGADLGEWPPNAWLGVSITSGADWWRWEALAKLPEHIHKMVSVEPLLGDGVAARMYGQPPWPEWVIVGPLDKCAFNPTVNSVRRVEEIRAACMNRPIGLPSIPLFEKPGLSMIPPIRQMPQELKAVYRKGGLND